MRNYLYFFVFSILFVPAVLHASMTGGDFEIYADSFSFVGSGSPISGSSAYALYGSGVQYETVSTTDSGNTFELRGGFQAQNRGILRYAVDTNTINLGTLTTSSVATSSVTVSFETDSHNGFALSVSEDGNLRDGANDIDDVADGEVTAGSEEYGISGTGGAELFADTRAIDGVLPVAGFYSEVSNGEGQIIFHAAVSDSTATGTYSHVVTLTLTVNP